MSRPTKKDLTDNFLHEPYCNSCRLSETFCQCVGFNECHDLFTAYEASKQEPTINFIIDKLEGYELDCLRGNTNDEMRQKRFRLAQAIAEKFKPSKKELIEARMDELKTQFMLCRGWMNTSFEKEIKDRIAQLKAICINEPELREVK